MGNRRPAVEPATHSILHQLRQNIQQLESATRADDNSVVQTGIRGLDQLLPHGGYRRGTIAEWIIAPRAFGRLSRSSGSASADFLSLATASAAAEDGGAIVIADPHRQFYPPAAAAMGLNLGNMIILRPAQTGGSYTSTHQNELYWAIDQSLRCSAVAAVWGALDCIGERWFRRFQLSAESSGCMGLFVRPPTALNRPSWSEVQWQVTPKPTEDQTKHLRHVQLELLRCRGGRTGRQINLAIDTITGSVHCPRVHREDERTPITTNPKPIHSSRHSSPHLQPQSRVS